MTTRTPTHCPYRSLQCGMELVQGPDEPLSVAARDFPTNRGGMCRKGWTAASLLERGDRLTRPLLRDRRGGALRPAAWDEALDRVADGFRSCQRRHGRDAAGVFGGGGCTVGTTDEAMLRVGRFIQYYRETARWLERTYAFMERVGLDAVRTIVVEDRDGDGERLDAALESSLAAYTDPWQEGRRPVTAGQFA